MKTQELTNILHELIDGLSNDPRNIMMAKKNVTKMLDGNKNDVDVIQKNTYLGLFFNNNYIILDWTTKPKLLTNKHQIMNL